MKAQCMTQQVTKSKGFDSFMYMVHTDCPHFTYQQTPLSRLVFQYLKVRVGRQPRRHMHQLVLLCGNEQLWLGN